METVSFKYIELVSPLLGTAESSSFFTHLLTFQFVLWELCTLKVRQLLIHLLRMEDSSLGISVLSCSLSSCCILLVSLSGEHKNAYSSLYV